MIGRELDASSVSTVMVDHEAGATAAFEHLYKLGHRKIAFLRGSKVVTDNGLKWKGIQGFARAWKLAFDRRLVVDLPQAGDLISGFEVGYRLTDNLLKCRRCFTALLAFDDITALGAIQALTNAGVRVPDQCSVIALDDSVPVGICALPLTAVRQPMESMGSIATSTLLEGMKAVQEKRECGTVHRKVTPELVVRESTRPC